MNTRDSLFIAVESPFSERDWQRFGIETLSQRFNVRIIDLSPIAQPVLHTLRSETLLNEPSISVIRNPEDLEDLLDSANGGALISNVGGSEIRHELFRLARNRDLLIAEFELGAMPDITRHQRSLWTQLVQRWRQMPSLWLLPKMIFKRIWRRSFDEDLPDVFYRGGLLARGKHPRLGKAIVDVHSLDFEFAQAIDQTNLRTDPHRIVYLDQNLGFHSDIPGLGLKQPVTANEFYPVINDYFDWLEHEHGFRVVICPHPRAEMSATRSRFPGKEISLMPTAREVARSVAVCGHVSTSFSYAVIFNKPALVLTTAELSRSWYAPYIDRFVEELSAPLVNLSTRDSWMMPAIVTSEEQESSYALYRANYLNASYTPNRKLWEFIGDDILERIRG